MIEYGISVAEVREGRFQQKAAIEIKVAFERAKIKGLQDPPLGSEVAEERTSLGPIRRGIESSMDLAIKHDPALVIIGAGLRSALDAAEKYGFVDKDQNSQESQAV